MTIKLTAAVIVPIAITDGMLVSCTAAEPAAGEIIWVSESTYAVGDIRIRTQTHRKYMRKTAGAGTTAPELDTTNWAEIGWTMRWAQFDKKIGSITTSTTDLATVIKPSSSAEGLALLDLVGRSVTVSANSATGGAVVYGCTISLDGTLVESVYDWMFNDFVQKRNVLLTDLPGQYPNIEITVTIHSTTGSAIGVLAVGRVMTIGAVQKGAGAGIINFGKVGDDGFGNRTWIEGDWASRVTLPLVGNTSDFNRIYRQLSAVRSKPCIYIGSRMDSMEPLVCYGVYRDLYITVPDTPLISMNLEIDGLNNS